MMQSEVTDITIFAFTFEESGIYDITDSFDGNKHLIISVIGDGE